VRTKSNYWSAYANGRVNELPLLRLAAESSLNDLFSSYSVFNTKLAQFAKYKEILTGLIYQYTNMGCTLPQGNCAASTAQYNADAAAAAAADAAYLAQVAAYNAA
jgi:hypothetical protein